MSTAPLLKHPKIHFLGAAGTVTGSKYLIETNQCNVMIDCGMFQGIKALRQLNWKDIEFDVSTIDYVLLTHGHLDHCGYLPRLVRQGFKGKIIGTTPTLEITRIVLRDSAKIHEEEAEKANKEGYAKHDIALPLYTLKDVKETERLFEFTEIEKWITTDKGLKFRFNPVGHIIGAAFIELEINEKILVFSGDVGRREDLLLEPPQKPRWADYLFLESTYGNKLHPKQNTTQILKELVLEIITSKGTLIIPSFAVERLQMLMYVLWKMYNTNQIPNIPIFIDSPMGNRVLSVFEQFSQWHTLEDHEYRAMIEHLNIVTSYAETWEVIDDPRPKIVIAGSGMVTGGRVLTYLQHYLDRDSTKVLLVGYQAEGTRGRLLLQGAHELKIYGKYYAVKARVHHIENLSAHADQAELLDWISEIKNIPEKIFLVHGEPGSLDALRTKINSLKRWHVHIPKLNELATLH